MFRTAPAAEPDMMVPADVIPLSVLSLDLSAPAEGWPAFLGRRGIAIVPDSLGRDSIGHDAAGRLLDERRADDLRRARLRAVAEREAVEADRQFRASLGRGIPATSIPAGSTYVEAAMQAELENASGGYRVGARRTLLEDALDGSQTLTFHSLAEHDEDES